MASDAADKPDASLSVMLEVMRSSTDGDADLLPRQPRALCQRHGSMK